MERACRVFLTYRERLSEKLGFDFVGPGHAVAVAVFKGEAADVEEAIRRGEIVIVSKEIPATNKSSPQAKREALEQAYRDLAEKLGEQQVLAILSDREWMRESRFKVSGRDDLRPALILPKGSISKETEVAAAVAEFVGRKRLELLRLEHPDLPWEATEHFYHQFWVARFGTRGLYDAESTELQAAIKEHGRKKKILLHVCCGPDAAGVIGQLKRDYEVVCFWYDPNIQPREEYDKRLEAFVTVAELEEVPYVVGEYDADRFFELIKGLEHTPEQGAKCSVCYDMRLERSAIEAKNLDCDVFTTTLAISPHKVQQKLKAFGELSHQRHGVPYLARNFMKDEGFKKSVEYTRDHGIYRQDYCGCLYSLHEGGSAARAMAKHLGLTQDQILRAHGQPEERQ